MSMEERILAKATELIDQRVAEIMDATSAPRIVRLDEYLTIESEQDEGNVDSFPWPYAGQLQLSDTQVFVVPFVVYGGWPLLSPDPSSDPPVIPKIKGTSIFSANRPFLPRLSGGAAVYIQKSSTLYVEDTGGIYSTLDSCEIIQQSIKAPFPRETGVVDWPYDADEPSEISIVTEKSKSTTLLGVYTADGQVYPGVIATPQRVSSYTDPLADGEYHYIYTPFVAPFTRIVTLGDPTP